IRGFSFAHCCRAGRSLFPSMEAEQRSETANRLAPGEHPGKGPKAGSGSEEVEETGAAISRVESPGTDVDRRIAKLAPGSGGNTRRAFVRPATRRRRRGFERKQRGFRRVPVQNDERPGDE